jgi:putative SOS response-associated peptidase YedK
MCGRYSLTTTIDQLLPRLKGPLPEVFLKQYQPRQQVRPGEPLLIQRQQQGRLEVGYALWGLVPSWLKDTRGKCRPVGPLDRSRWQRTPDLLHPHHHNQRPAASDPRPHACGDLGWM